MADYQLSYTASEINEKLGKIGQAVSWNDLTDKPFYATKTFKEVVPETSLSFEDMGSGEYGAATTPTEEQYRAWVGDWENCTIVYDGVTYECEPKDYYGIKAVGNVELMDGVGDSGHPFTIAITDLLTSTMQLIVFSMTDTEPTTHTLSMSMTVEDVHPLDTKFIDKISWGKISGKPFEEFATGTVIADEDVVIQSETTPLIIDWNKIVNGVQYTITINDTVYTTQGLENDSIKALDIVNPEDTAQDIFLLLSAYQGFVSDTLTVGETYHIKIAFAEDCVKPIDAKFLPSTLPEITTEDNNKVLKVVDGEWLVAEAPTGIPEVTEGDEGKFLRIVDGVAVWQTIQNASEVQF